MNKIVKLGLKPDIMSKLIFVSDQEHNTYIAMARHASQETCHVTATVV
jgi:hypothetical protein